MGVFMRCVRCGYKTRVEYLKGGVCIDCRMLETEEPLFQAFLEDSGRKIFGRGNATIIVDADNKVLFEGHSEFSFRSGMTVCFGGPYITDSYDWHEIASADIFDEVVRVRVNR